MNRYISDTDKKHLQRRVDTNNHCSFLLGKVHCLSRLHIGSPRGRVLPSPHQCKMLPNPSIALYFTRKAGSMGQTQHNVPQLQGRGSPPAPSIWDKLCRDHSSPAVGKARYGATAGLGFVKTTRAKLSFKPRQQHGGPSLQKGRGATATVELRALSSSATLQCKKPNIIPLLVV